MNRTHDPYAMYVDDVGQISCVAHPSQHARIVLDAWAHRKVKAWPLSCDTCGMMPGPLEPNNRAARGATTEYPVRFVSQEHATICLAEESGLRWWGEPGHEIGERIKHDGRIATLNVEQR